MIPFILISGLLLIVLGMFLPELHLMHARPFLPPLVVAYAVLRFSPLQALGVAAGLGVFLDGFSAGRLGFSSLSFILMVLFILSQKENLKYDFAPHVLLLTLMGVFVYLLSDYLFFCLQVQTWRWPFRVWWGLVGQSLLDTVIALPFYWFLDGINRWFQARQPSRISSRS